jgi:hypothetical protein
MLIDIFQKVNAHAFSIQFLATTISDCCHCEALRSKAEQSKAISVFHQDR